MIEKCQQIVINITRPVNWVSDAILYTNSERRHVGGIIVAAA